MLPLSNITEKDMIKAMEDIHNNENDVLRQIFGKKIKQSFLIEMKERVVKSKDFITLISSIYDFDFKINMVLGYANWDYDVCKYITMIHFNNTLFLTDDERGSLQKDNQYKNKLFSQVIEAIKLKKFGTLGLQHESIESYLPITYAANACDCYLINVFNEMNQKGENLNIKNKKFKFATLYKILLKIKASLILIDNCLFEEAYNPLRSAIELYMIFLTVGESSETAISSYFKFFEYKLYYQEYRQLPKEVVDVFNKLKLSNKVTIIDYLNYGWLDSIFEYGYIGKSERQYKLKDVADLINMKYQKENKNLGSNLYEIYRSCNQMSHGFTGNINAFSAKIELSQKCVYILNHISSIVKPLIEYNYNFIVNDVDIIEYMNRILKELVDVMNKNNSLDKIKKLNDDYTMFIK